MNNERLYITFVRRGVISYTAPTFTRREHYRTGGIVQARPILDIRPQALYKTFLSQCRDLGLDTEEIDRIATATQLYIKSKAKDRDTLRPGQELEKRWYDSLDGGEPDYSVYDTLFYLADLWVCWQTYSRKYLLGIQKHNSLPPSGIVGSIGQAERVIDLGCGIGYTTAALAGIFPSAEVTGTNLPDIIQVEFARALQKHYNFNLCTDLNNCTGPADLVFASEYFEHHIDPITHLHEVLDRFSPSHLLTANAFGTRSIGHFQYYIVNGRAVHENKIAKRFGAALKSRGYSKVKTGLWNNRPAYYKRSVRPATTRPTQEESTAKDMATTPAAQQGITWHNETRKLRELVPWDQNPKILSDKQGRGLQVSINKFGFALPLLISPDSDIYDGHQRTALMEQMRNYGPEAEVDVRVSSRPLTNAEQRELTVRLKENQADWDFEMLGNLYQVQELEQWGMEDFALEEFETYGDDEEEDIFYTRKIVSPEYVPTGKDVTIPMLTDEDKYHRLCSAIAASSLSDEQKRFLTLAAGRHVIFDYANIAEMYAQADAEMQQLMEDSVLVIIDFDQAIAGGYVKLSEEIGSIYLDDKEVHDARS